jgi:hypothetical protein
MVAPATADIASKDGQVLLWLCLLPANHALRSFACQRPTVFRCPSAAFKSQISRVAPLIHENQYINCVITGPGCDQSASHMVAAAVLLVMLTVCRAGSLRNGQIRIAMV